MIVFKQNYAPRSRAATPGLNVRHMHYIATRPGAVYNLGCGFCLWGKRPGEKDICDIQDLHAAENQIYQVSQQHTVYRALISIGQEDAELHGMYGRNKWEQFIGDHVSVLAKEMDIAEENFCWYASYHFKKGHPHVHLMYWDNSEDPRPEGISKERFAIMAERVRAEFGKDLYREELKEAQSQQREEAAAIRTALRAICQEANPEAALSPEALYSSGQADAIGTDLAELVQAMPKTGSLRYAYLPPAYKAQVDALVDRLLREIPDLQKQMEKYRGLAEKIARYYGNGEETAARNLDKAVAKIKRELGNEVMQAVCSLKDELIADHPQNLGQLQQVLDEGIRQVEGSDKRKELMELLPPERIPTSSYPPEAKELLHSLTETVLDDARIRLPMQGYIHEQTTKAGLDPKQDKEEIRQIWRETYRQAHRYVENEINHSVREEKGYNQEAYRTYGVGLAVALMRLLSMGANQQQAVERQARNALKTRSKDKSKEAQKDYWATQQSGGGWGDGLEQN